MRVMIQLRSSPGALVAAGGEPATALTANISKAVPGLVIDALYPPARVPLVRTASGVQMSSLSQPLVFAGEPESSTYVVRGTIPDETATTTYVNLVSQTDVVGVYSDPLVQSCVVCPDSPPQGTAADVANLLDVQNMHAAGMDGHNVYLAVVDTGINVAYLKSRGQNPTLKARMSWTSAGVTTRPGRHAVNHGTMCAYDASIGAPRAQLLDYAVLLSNTPGANVMAGLLSDAVLAYSKLRDILLATPAAKRAMVITNSWGMFSPNWDFPPGHPGNYSDNPNHPFNIIVASLENAGADIFFAAGNCGRDCPDGRCAFGVVPPICGANSHPSVISVAGVDTSGARVGYSSQGPGRLTSQKPDIAAYTHFQGSGVYSADSGTSAACPIAAGIVAAIRSKHPASALTPAQLRALIYKTARDVGSTGFDFDYGWGIIDTQALRAALS